MTPAGDLKIQFLGAAGTVTGSKYLVTFAGQKILVDCGLFQGQKDLRLRNWAAFPVDPKTIDAVVLTHAHIDHSGYIPRLIKEGFRGQIFCTPETLALCRILLPDAGYLQEEEAEYLNRKKLSKHQPALPLFDRSDAERAIEQFTPCHFHEDFQPTPGMTARFLYAGHILGAAMVVLRAGQSSLGFSGDLGRMEDPVLNPPEKMPEVDALVVESTYGDRDHGSANPMDELEKFIVEAKRRRSVIVVPAFAVGRTQNLLFYLSELKKAKRIPDFPMYLNSPMAKSVTEALGQFRSAHKLTDAQCAEMEKAVHYIGAVSEFKRKKFDFFAQVPFLRVDNLPVIHTLASPEHCAPSISTMPSAPPTPLLSLSGPWQNAVS